MPINFLSTIVFEKIWEASQSGKYKLIEEKGSSRSSKTWSNFQVLFLDLYENPMTTCTILRDTQKSCREIIETDWIKWISDPMGRKKQLEDKKITIQEFDTFVKKENLSKYFLRNKTNHTWTFLHNNSFIRFTGLDDEDDAMGMTQDICWINEPYNFSHEVYKQLGQRTSKYILFDWNPKQRHWIDIERKKENTITIHSTFRDNPFCPEESRKQILSYQPVSECFLVKEELLTNETAFTYDLNKNTLNFCKKHLNELERCLYNEKTESSSLYHWLVYGMGEKSEKPNKIYHNWKEIDRHVKFEDIPYPSYYGLDFGSRNPSALVEVKFDGEKTFFIQELFYTPRNELSHSLGTAFETIIKNKSIPLVCDYAEPDAIFDLRKEGYNAIPCNPKNVKSTINFLQNSTVYASHDSDNLWSEYETYEWEIVQNVNLERPLKINDHLLDALRYITDYIKIKHRLA